MEESEGGAELGDDPPLLRPTHPPSVYTLLGIMAAQRDGAAFISDQALRLAEKGLVTVDRDESRAGWWVRFSPLAGERG